ncbi:MAG: tyrosine-type recombinase/integrase [Bryobacteraceae bacterium]
MNKYTKNGLPAGMYWKRGVIYVDIRHDGKRLGLFSTGTADKDHAIGFRKKKTAELLKKVYDENHIEVEKGIRCADLFQDYIANRQRREQDSGAYGNGRKYETNSYKVGSKINKHLLPWFGKLKPDELTSDMLLEFRDKRRKDGAQVATINNEFRILRAALRRGTKTTPRKVNLLHIPDFSEVINEKAEKKAARTDTISEEQFKLIMEHASEHLKPVITTCMYTGARAKEIKFVRRDQVDFNENEIRLKVGETKNGETRILPMNQRVRAVLLEWEARTQENFPKTQWFFHEDGNQLGNWKTAWNGTLRRAGLRVPVIEKGKPKVNANGEAVWKRYTANQHYRYGRTRLTGKRHDGDRWS